MHFCYERTSPSQCVKARLLTRMLISFASSFYRLPLLFNRKLMFAVVRAEKFSHGKGRTVLLVNFCVCTKMNVFALVLTCLRVTLTRVITRVRLSLYIPNIFSYSLKRGCNKFTAPFCRKLYS